MPLVEPRPIGRVPFHVMLLTRGQCIEGGVYQAAIKLPKSSQEGIWLLSWGLSANSIRLSVELLPSLRVKDMDLRFYTRPISRRQRQLMGG